MTKTKIIYYEPHPNIHDPRFKLKLTKESQKIFNLGYKSYYYMAELEYFADLVGAKLEPAVVIKS